MLIGTAIFLSLIVIVLAVPVTLTYQLSWKQTLSAQCKLNWAFGLVRADVSPDPGKPETAKSETAPEKASWWRRSERKKANFFAAIREPGFRQRMLRFVSDVWRAIHKKNVRLLVRLGLGDPADTGQLWAVIGPLAGMLACVRDATVVIEPDFLASTLDVDSSGTIRVIPLQLTIIALGLIVSPAVWRGVMLMRATG